MSLPSKLGGVLLVAGTCIGAVTLALPISTAAMGFYWTLAVFVMCWLAMLLAGWLVLEVSLSLPAGTSFVSMAKTTLGPIGEWVTWGSYLLLLYSLLAAYFNGGGDLVRGVWQQTHGNMLAVWTGVLPWVLLGAGVLYAGTAIADRVNRILVMGLMLSFMILGAGLSLHINPAHLLWKSPSEVTVALPIVITAFGYQVVIPTLRRYFEGTPRALPGIVALGSFLPLLVYSLWALDIFGVFPSRGAHSLQQLLASGHPAGLLPQYLSTILQHAWVTWVVAAFGLFAIASSFIGIALSLFDFLADGFHLSRQGSGRVLLVVLTLLPPLAYAVYYPQGFILALSYAGIFVALLNGIIPVLMTWARRRQAVNDPGIVMPYRTPGSYLTYTVVVVFSLGVIVADIVGRLN